MYFCTLRNRIGGAGGSGGSGGASGGAGGAGGARGGASGAWWWNPVEPGRLIYLNPLKPS